MVGLDIKNSCIFFSGIGVLISAILGKKAINNKESTDENYF